MRQKLRLKLPPWFAAAVPADLGEALLRELHEEVDEHVEAHANDRASDAVRRVLCANYGEPLGNAIVADLDGTADVPNSALVGGTVSRAMVSKISCRIRRGLGLRLSLPFLLRPLLR